MFVSKTVGSPYLNLPIDTNFSNNVLLIHGDGVSGANNSMFIDNSLANTYIPFNGTSSYYFNGGTERITTASSSTLAVSGDFTIEMWIYPTYTATASQVCLYNTGVGNFFLQTNSSTFSIGTAGSSIQATYTYTIPSNTWTHIAVSRNGTTARGFINGNLISSPTVSNNWSQAGAIIGNLYNGTQPFVGYISNVRYVSGSALYTEAFTPSTSELTNVGGTQLLTAQNPTSAQTPSTQQPSVFKDNSPNNLTFTITGAPAITTGGAALVPTSFPGQGTFTPFTQYGTDGWSVNFNGSTDYFTVTGVPAAGTGNFTMEFWLYNSKEAWTGNFDITDGSAGALTVYFNDSIFRIAPQGSASTSLGNFQNLNVLVKNWNHFVVIKSSNTTRGYVNGVAIGDAVADTNNYSAFTKLGGTADGYTFGNISNFRFVNNANVYDINSSTLPVPLAPLTAVTGTQLLTFQNYFVKDNSTNALTFTPSGTPTIQSRSPYARKNVYSKSNNSGSVYFNGSSYLTLINNAGVQFGSGNFTIEAWIYNTSSAASNKQIFAHWGAGSSNPAYQFFLRTNNRLCWQIYTQNSPDNSNLDVPINSWVHVMWVKSGTTCYLFINGTLKDTTTGVTNSPVDGLATNPTIGSSGAAEYFTGYISNLRILKGTALYTASFTPPASPLLPIANTTFLLSATNAGVIDQTGRNVLASYGGTSVSSVQSKFGGSSINFNGSTGSYVMPSSQNITIPASGDFTIECWLYTPTASLAPAVLQNVTNTRIIAFMLTDAVSPTVLLTILGDANYPAAGNSNLIRANRNITVNTWTHVAFVRSNSEIRIYIDGTDAVASKIFNQYATNALQVVGAIAQGGAPNFYFFNGYIDGLRMTKTALYSTFTAVNFTPPSRKLADR